MCMEIQAPTSSSMASTAWIRISRGVTQWARETSDFAPEMAGMDTVFVNGGTAVAQPQSADPDLCIGRPIAFHHESTPPSLCPGQPDSVMPGIG